MLSVSVETVKSETREAVLSLPILVESNKKGLWAVLITYEYASVFNIKKN